jgi:hypothetical protein
MKNLFTTALLTKLRTIINTRNVKALSTTCLMVVFAIQFAWAAPLPSCSQLAISSSLGLSGINHAGNLATKFTVLPGKSIRVTELGVYDEAQNGMNMHDVPVGILKDDGMGGTIVVCTITFSGTAGTLASSSPFRMQPITPVVLGPGDYYVSAVFTNYNQYANSSTTTNGNPSYGTLDGYISFGANPCGYNGNSTLALPVNPDSYQYHAATFTAEPITNITTQPTGGNKGFGEAVSLTTAADGTVPVSYDWYSNTNNSNFGGNHVGTTDTYMPLTSTIGSKYYYAIASAGCTSANGSDKDTSDVIEITVNPVKNTTTNVCYPTLQAAIDAASSGNTISVLTNITEGSIEVNKNVIITSPDPITAITTSSTTSYGVRISSPCQFLNLTLQGDGVAGLGKFGLLTDCAADNLTLNSVTVNNFGATGFAITGTDNSYFYTLKSTNNKGNGISITNCTNSTFSGITTSGNAFGGGFNAGVGLFTSNAYCLPATTSSITINGVINIAEQVKLYDEPASGSPIGSVTFAPASGSTVPAFTHFMGIGTQKYYAPSLAAAKGGVSATITPALKPFLHIEEIATGKKYVYNASPAMSIQAAINYTTDDKTIVIEDGTYPEPVIDINKNVTFELATENGVTLQSATIATSKELKNNKSFNVSTITNNGLYGGKGWNGKLINSTNGIVAPKQ